MSLDLLAVALQDVVSLLPQAHTADFVGLWSTGSSPVEPLVPACTSP